MIVHGNVQPALSKDIKSIMKMEIIGMRMLDGNFYTNSRRFESLSRSNTNSQRHSSPRTPFDQCITHSGLPPLRLAVRRHSLEGCQTHSMLCFTYNTPNFSPAPGRVNPSFIITDNIIVMTMTPIDRRFISDILA